MVDLNPIVLSTKKIDNLEQSNKRVKDLNTKETTAISSPMNEDHHILASNITYKEKLVCPRHENFSVNFLQPFSMDNIMLKNKIFSIHIILFFYLKRKKYVFTSLELKFSLLRFLEERVGYRYLLQNLQILCNPSEDNSYGSRK